MTRYDARLYPRFDLTVSTDATLAPGRYRAYSGMRIEEGDLAYGIPRWAVGVRLAPADYEALTKQIAADARREVGEGG